MSDHSSRTDISSIGAASLRVLNSASPADKSKLSIHYAKQWFAGNLVFDFSDLPPERPARPEKPELLLPKFMPKRRQLGQHGNLIALLHAVAHIEFNAIDLAWDMVGRFGGTMPREFTDDWVQVAEDEARHFNMLQARLESYGASYGDCPAHDGLWQSAMDTAHDLKARLAIVPMVLEARGLDVTPAMIERLLNSGDRDSAEALTVIYEEEIHHVFAGQKWFKYLCKQDNLDPQAIYQQLVKQYFKGHIKPPFNKKAREDAGLEEAFYLPLTMG